MTDQLIRAKDDDRLRGWKEIAVALHASERTAQRWEETMGLPVHRVPGTRGDQVFAYRSELDAWMESDRSREVARSPRPPEREEFLPAVAAEPSSATSRLTGIRWGVAALVLGGSIVAVAGVSWWSGVDATKGGPLSDSAPNRQPTAPPPATVRPVATPIMLKITVNRVSSVIGVADGKLARVSVPGQSTTLGLTARAVQEKVAVRVFRVEGTTVSGEPLVADATALELTAGSPSRCAVGPLEVVLEWLSPRQGSLGTNGRR